MALNTRSARALPKRWPAVVLLVIGLLLSLPVLVITFALQLPASVLSAPVSALTQGNVRLVLTSGSIQSGRAELWVRDPARRDWSPWMPLEWRLMPSLQNGILALLLVTNKGSLRIDHAGASLINAEFNVPPNLLLSGIQHPLASAPWQGDIQIKASQFFCPWSGLKQKIPACDGQATLRLLAVGSSILPLQNFGSYATLVSAHRENGGVWRADITTESGAVALTGYAESKQGVLRYRINIKGENALIGGLNSVAGPSFRRVGNTGEFVLEK